MGVGDRAVIAEVIKHYYPGWDPPEDQGNEWERCCCPFHGENNPSAAVSYDHDAYNCMACDWRGDVYKIIQRKEGVSFGEAKRIAEGFASGSGDRVSLSASRESGRDSLGGTGVFGGRPSGSNRKVQARVRRRPFTGL